MESAPVENVLASSRRCRWHRSEGMSIVRSVRVASTEQPFFESTLVARHKSIQWTFVTSWRPILDMVIFIAFADVAQW